MRQNGPNESLSFKNLKRLEWLYTYHILFEHFRFNRAISTLFPSSYRSESDLGWCPKFVLRSMSSIKYVPVGQLSSPNASSIDPRLTRYETEINRSASKKKTNRQSADRNPLPGKSGLIRQLQPVSRCSVSHFFSKSKPTQEIGRYVWFLTKPKMSR